MISPLEEAHAGMVKRLVKPSVTIKEELSARDCNLVHAILGISGEVGELLDAIKKNTIYRKPLDKVNVIEELGDLEFYLEMLRQELGLSREECLQANIDKLSKRYDAGKYTNLAAIARADKQSEEAAFIPPAHGSTIRRNAGDGQR